ncbi:MAG: M3 family peptidase, partial [Microbacteriaceae bacterium]
MTFNEENPFAHRSTLPYELPPFDRIANEHYLPAFYAGCEAHLAEIDAIVAQPSTTFENTIVAMERAGALLGRMLFVFYNKSSSDTSDELDAIEAEIAPKLAAHQDAIHLNPELFKRIKSLHEDKDLLLLDAESDWLLERYYRDFVHAGAHLTEQQRETLKGYNERLSVLQTQFDQRQHTDVNDLAIVVDSIEELDGLSETQIATLAAAADSRGLLGKWVIPMVNYTGHPLLSSLTNRSLRERIMRNSLSK